MKHENKHLLSLANLSSKDALFVINLAKKIKQNPKKFKHALKDKTLLMIFEKPSLRTRVSFEVGMTQLGGHAIYYDVSTSPLGKKETIEDTAKTVSRYVDIIMARMFKFSDIKKLAQNASIPVIDALSDENHPCQILGDLLTILEKKKSFKKLKLVYFGDCENNVTYSLMHGCALMGIDMVAVCPKDKEFMPKTEIVDIARNIAKKTNVKIEVSHDVQKSATGADVIYTDSWMSYHVDPKKANTRIKKLKPYQVTEKVLSYAKDNVIFMNCLPAMRGMEQTEDVIDGKNSIVFDQAENRLHIQKAIMLWLLKINK